MRCCCRARAVLGAARLAAVVVALCGAACSAAEGPIEAGATDQNAESAWGLPVELELRTEAGRQLSSPLTIERGGRGFALFVEGDGCFQVARLESGAPKRVWVPTLERGVSCAQCAERFSVLAGSGLVVHAPPEPDDSDAMLRFGAIDCESLTPQPPGAAPGSTSLRAWVRPLPRVGDLEPLAVAFRHGPASPFSSPRAAAQLAEEIGVLLASAGLELELVDSIADPSLDARLEWFEGKPDGLPSPGEAGAEIGAVPVAFGGCLERIHPLLGTRALLDAFVPRVPAHGSPGSAVYLRHRGCSRESDAAIVRPVETEARLVAHELGHFLGLYHPEDSDGQRDRLPDTDDDTLMGAKLTADSPSFSPLQAARLRLHAALLAGGLPGRWRQ